MDEGFSPDTVGFMRRKREKEQDSKQRSAAPAIPICHRSARLASVQAPIKRLFLEVDMAVNKPKGDSARKAPVKKRSQLKTMLGGVTAWTKRNKKDGEFMAVKKAAAKKESREKV